MARRPLGACALSDDKRYAPTPARRRRARSEGNVARSAELASVAAFGAALTTAWLAVPLVAAALADALRAASRSGPPAVPASIGFAAVAALAPAAAAATAGSAVALAQAGGLYPAPVHLDLKRLDPVAGLKRMFGGEALIAAVRALAAAVAAIAAVAPLGRDAVASAGVLAAPQAVWTFAGAAALRACTAALAVGFTFAGADYVLVRRRWLRSLRMSLEELKRDAKENDGDPQSRARRKGLHRDLVRGALSRVREASFVVVNPTHVAVAIRYAPPAVPVPEILVPSMQRRCARESSPPHTASRSSKSRR